MRLYIRVLILYNDIEMDTASSRFRTSELAILIIVGSLVTSILIVTGCKQYNPQLQPITRNEVMVIADRYADYIWKATTANLFDGQDPDSVKVKTPEWIPGQTNQGVAYQWGGFASIEEFEVGISQGKYAGDIDCTQLETSQYAVGVDCSGLVSRCWNLPEKESTRSLPKCCIPLKSTGQLQAGDILNKYDFHVLLFKNFVDGSNSDIECYEAKLSGVIRSRHNLDDLLKEGYKPYRYRLIID